MTDAANIHANSTANGQHPPHSARSEMPFTEAERNAMRGYLQRCEVRLSTLHRIATAFISGAGLLLLIPVFFRDVINDIMTVFLTQASNLFPRLGEPGGEAFTLVMFGLLLYPLLLSLAIPLYGVFLLLKDIIHFYFTVHMPGFDSHLLNPTFSLNAIAFSPDESALAKREVMRFQYKTEHMQFMMAFSEGKRHEYFDNLIEATDAEILPPSRRMEHLEAEGWLPEDFDRQEVMRFNAAFGIARSLDRRLVEEVALTEMALVRAVLYLRRLMLRYVKTLLMFIWTTATAFLMIPFLHNDRFPTFVMLALGYTLWSVGVMRIIRQPLNWIYRYRLGDVNPEHVDAQLTQMENHLYRYCQLAVICAVSGLALALLAWVSAL
jgi:hypothetical protein